MKTIHIATTSNSGYFPGLEVLLTSTLLHARRDTTVHFYVIDAGLTEKEWVTLREHGARLHPKAFLHPLPFSGDRFAGFPEMHGNTTPYARFLLGEYLPEVEKILYVDADVLVGCNPESLFELEMQGRTAMAADDAFISRLSGDCPWLPVAASQHYRYFNAGILLLDLNRWRKLDYLGLCLAAIRSKPDGCRFMDQTALNYVLRDDVGTLPRLCNYITLLSETLPDEPANFHLVGEKPWVKHVFRSDHLLWRAFYEEVVDPNRQWPASSRVLQRLLQSLAFSPAFNWAFGLSMRFLVLASRHEHQRSSRRLAQRAGLRSPALIQQARTEWRRKLDASSPQEGVGSADAQPALSMGAAGTSSPF